MNDKQTKTEAGRPATLAGKLCAVLSEVSAIPKNGENKFHGYKYMKEGDVAAATWLRDTLYGKPMIRQEISGADGAAVSISYAVTPPTPNGDNH